MSRLSQVFRSKSKNDSAAAVGGAAAPSAPAAPSCVPNIGSFTEGIPTATIQERCFLDGVLPNAADAAAGASQGKYLARVEGFDLHAALKRLPLLTRVVHRLPQPVQDALRAALRRVSVASAAAPASPQPPPQLYQERGHARAAAADEAASQEVTSASITQAASEIASQGTLLRNSYDPAAPAEPVITTADATASAAAAPAPSSR